MRDPRDNWDCINEFLVATAAVRTGLLDAASERPYDAKALARVTGLDRRAVARLIDALVHYGILMETQVGYALTPEGRATYHPRDGRARWLSLLHVDVARDLLELPKVLESGTPIGSSGDDPVRLRNWIYAQTERPPEVLERAAALFLRGLPESPKVLDLGGGPGHMSRLFMDAGADVTLFDIPPVIDLVRPDLEGTQHLRLVAGDATQGLPAGETYDAVYAGNLTPLLSNEDNREMFKRVAQHIRPGGRFGVQVNLGHRSPRAPIASLHFLLKTNGGDAWPLERYEHWFDDAGFTGIEAHDLDEDLEYQLVCAVRP